MDAVRSNNFMLLHKTVEKRSHLPVAFVDSILKNFLKMMYVIFQKIGFGSCSHWQYFQRVLKNLYIGLTFPITIQPSSKSTTA